MWHLIIIFICKTSSTSYFIIKLNLKLCKVYLDPNYKVEAEVGVSECARNRAFSFHGLFGV